MQARKTQNAFMAGEVSPSMYGRSDDQKYGQGLAICRNFIPKPQGPVSNRTGFAFVREAKYADKPSRLLPFQFSTTQTMVVELGEKYARFHTNGQTLLNDEGQPYEITTPYEARDVGAIRFVQAGDVMTLVHTLYPPMELRRYGPIDWRLVQVKFTAPVKAPTGVRGSFSHVAPKNVEVKSEEVSRYTYKYKVTAVAGVRSASDGVDNQESMPSEVCKVTGNLYLENAMVTLNWTAVEGAERYRVYKSYKGLYGYIGETTETRFEDDNYKADEERTIPLYDDPFNQAKGIKSVEVLNGGSGYPNAPLVVPKGASIYGDIDGWRNDESQTGYYGREGDTLNEVLGEWQEQSLQKYSGTCVLPVYDKDGNGSGGEVECDCDYGVRGGYKIGYNGGSWADTSSFAWRWYESFITLKGTPRVISYWTGYTSPYVSWPKGDVTAETLKLEGGHVALMTLFYRPVKLKADSSRELLRLEAYDLTAFLRVEDATGTGAVLEPVINNGVIEAVNVRNAGYGYTAPTIRLVGAGQGATFRVNIADVGDYPGAVAYYEQRRVFAGTRAQPQALWMSRTGTESDMTYTLPAKDDNRIKFRISAQEASRIQHVVPLSNLVVLTSGTEFRVTSVNSDAITPKSISVKPQSYIGASDVQPVVVNSAMVYGASRGGHVRELGYSYQAQGFVSGDLSLRAAHLFERDRVVSMTLQKAPDPIVWCAMQSGQLLGLTYMPDQGIGGWHRHDTKDGAFEAVTCVSEGDEDVLYAVVRRSVNGKQVRYVERMAETFNGVAMDGFYVDCGATYRGMPTKRISGLRWLEGKEVAVLADGAVLGRKLVTNGAIELEEEVSYAHVGLPIEADLQTLPAVFPNAADGSTGKGHAKNVNQIWAQLYQSSGFKAGASFESLVEAKPRFEEAYGTPPLLHSGEVSIVPETAWGADGVVSIRHDTPLPLTIVSLTWQFM